MDRPALKPQQSVPVLALPPSRPVWEQPPQEMLAIEGPIYVDAQEVNRPDPPMEAGPALMLMNRPSTGDTGSDSSEENNKPHLAIMPEAAADFCDDSAFSAYSMKYGGR